MPLKSEESAYLKRVFQNLNPLLPLKPGDAFYQPVYELQANGDDPVARLQTTIEYSEGESSQFFSGFRGSGKTTELFRLKSRLEENDYIVLYADALAYINPAQPLDISDLLIVLAGAFSDALTEFDPAIEIAGESYWTRLSSYLTSTQVGLSEISAGVKDAVSLKLALKSTPTFRQKLQEIMASRLSTLEAQVQKFFEDGVKAVRNRHPETRIVFLFDQLEQIRGSLFNEREVIASVERVFTLHLERLKLPYIHFVCTVPPWLKFVLPGVKTVTLHSIRQWGKGTERAPFAEGDDCLLALMRRRFDGDLRPFFGDEANARELVAVCGGHFRDLLRLCREAVVRADSLPVSNAVIRSSITEIRTSFLPIAIDDAVWLQRISESRTSVLQNTAPDAVARFTRFLDTHFVLYLRNGEEWYDIHPLIREDVKYIAEMADAKTAAVPPVPENV